MTLLLLLRGAAPGSQPQMNGYHPLAATAASSLTRISETTKPLGSGVEIILRE